MPQVSGFGERARQSLALQGVLHTTPEGTRTVVQRPASATVWRRPAGSLGVLAIVGPRQGGGRRSASSSLARVLKCGTGHRGSREDYLVQLGFLQNVLAFLVLLALLKGLHLSANAPSQPGPSCAGKQTLCVCKYAGRAAEAHVTSTQLGCGRVSRQPVRTSSFPPNMAWQITWKVLHVTSGRAHIHPAQHGLAIYAGDVCHAVQAGHQQTLLLGPEGDVDPAHPPPCRACWPAQPRGPELPRGAGGPLLCIAKSRRSQSDAKNGWETSLARSLCAGQTVASVNRRGTDAPHFPNSICKCRCAEATLAQ